MKKRSGNKASAVPGHKEKPAAVSQKPRTDRTKPHPAATAPRVLRKVPAGAAALKDGNTVPPPKEENMEVHHHHRSTGKTSWKHYGYEFFMLFLAVFCGFLAEWQLEHAIERQREKQFIRSLAEDLKRDTAEAAAYIRFNEDTLQYCDSLQACLTRPDLLQNSNDFDYSRELARLARYSPTDRTMQQLKNAGNMRLIRKWHVSNAITAYDSQTKLLTELDDQLNNQKAKYRDHLIQFLDLSSYDRLNEPDSYMESFIQTRGNPGFIAMDENKAKLLYNEAFTVRIFSDLLIRSAAGVKKEAGQLLEILEEEYGVE